MATAAAGPVLITARNPKPSEAILAQNPSARVMKTPVGSPLRVEHLRVDCVVLGERNKKPVACPENVVSVASHEWRPDPRLPIGEPG
jgi:hypothetical protein